MVVARCECDCVRMGFSTLASDVAPARSNAGGRLGCAQRRSGTRINTAECARALGGTCGAHCARGGGGCGAEGWVGGEREEGGGAVNTQATSGGRRCDREARSPAHLLGHEEGHEQLDDTNDEQNDALRKRERVGLSGRDHHGAVEQIEVAASDAAGSWAGRLPADSAAGWGRQQAPCEAQGAWRATAGGAPELTMCA